MSLQNLTVNEMQELSPDKIEQTVNGLLDSVQMVDGVEVLPGIVCQNWKYIRMFLLIAKIFTPGVIDALIDKLIKIGDKSCKIAA